jgi:hypothetical protein
MIMTAIGSTTPPVQAAVGGDGHPVPHRVAEAGLLPLVIGVTGHCDLAPSGREALEREVEGIFERLERDYGATPFVVLSSLARGADSLVARVALRRPRIRLIAPLPMVPEEYAKDFEAPEALAEFHDLLARADPWFPLPDAAGAPAPEGSARDERYALAGAFIARHCHILLALWDGEPGKPGGTADAVDFKLKGVPAWAADRVGPLDAPDTGPVYQIVTPRASCPGLRESPGLIERYPTILRTETEAKEAFEKIRRSIDEFNRDAKEIARDSPGEIARSREWALPPGEAATLSRGPRSILDRYAVADALARRFQGRVNRTLYALLALAFIAAALFQAHIYLRKHDPGVPGPARLPVARAILVISAPDRVYLTALDLPYLGLLALAYGLFDRSRRRGDRRKHLDYRAVAEGLRVQLFWKLAGLSAAVADFYLRKQKGELAWIRSAIRSGDIPSDRGDAAAPGRQALARVVALWVDAQREFYERRAEAAAVRGRLIDRLKKALFYVGLAFLLVRAFAPPENLVVIFLALTLAGAVLLNIYTNLRAFSQLAKHYSAMNVLFADGRRRLVESQAHGRAAEGLALLRELGKESLAENGEWVLLHRERPLEFPRA